MPRAAEYRLFFLPRRICASRYPCTLEIYLTLYYTWGQVRVLRPQSGLHTSCCLGSTFRKPAETMKRVSSTNSVREKSSGGRGAHQLSIKQEMPSCTDRHSYNTIDEYCTPVGTMLIGRLLTISRRERRTRAKIVYWAWCRTSSLDQTVVDCHLRKILLVCRICILYAICSFPGNEYL